MEFSFDVSNEFFSVDRSNVDGNPFEVREIFLVTVNLEIICSNDGLKVWC